MHGELIVKVCGMRESTNIREVEALGIDMMGFIFHPHSPRYVNIVPEYLPTKCRRVGVFVNAEIDEILRRAWEFGLDVIQLHGAERPEFCKELRERICAIRMSGARTPLPRSQRLQGEVGTAITPGEVVVIKAVTVAKAAEYEGAVDMLLFDTPCVGYGGSGRRFDWNLLDEYDGQTPFMLSGGIGPESVEAIQAIKHPRLAGIDLNSRFELSPGLKSAVDLHRFLTALKNNFRNS